MMSGWLLDDGLLCIGLGCNGFDMVTYTDPQAIRFLSSHDAENFGLALKRIGFGYLVRRTNPVEHGWE